MNSNKEENKATMKFYENHMFGELQLRVCSHCGGEKCFSSFASSDYSCLFLFHCRLVGRTWPSAKTIISFVRQQVTRRRHQRRSSCDNAAKEATATQIRSFPQQARPASETKALFCIWGKFQVLSREFLFLCDVNGETSACKNIQSCREAVNIYIFITTSQHDSLNNKKFTCFCECKVEFLNRKIYCF